MSTDWYEFRGFDRESVRDARKRYLLHFRAGGRILDVGAGRGEFLSAAAEAGFNAEGIDSDRAAVAAATGAGSKVVQADAHDFLVTHPREFDGVFCSHLIEHLTPTDARRLVEGIAGALNQDGVLCLVTPNPGSLPTATHEFWRDPSHTRPYDLEALEFLCLSAGLEIVESGRNPDSERGLPIDPDDLEFAETEREVAGPDERQPRIAGVVAAQFDKSRMARDLKAMIHQQRMRIDELEGHVRLLRDSLRRLLDVLYEPSEIFVVARKP